MCVHKLGRRRQWNRNGIAEAAQSPQVETAHINAPGHLFRGSQAQSKEGAVCCRHNMRPEKFCACICLGWLLTFAFAWLRPSALEAAAPLSHRPYWGSSLHTFQNQYFSNIPCRPRKNYRYRDCDGHCTVVVRTRYRKKTRLQRPYCGPLQDL